MLRRSFFTLIAAAGFCLAAAPAFAEAEDAGALMPSFAEGDIIDFDGIKKLKPFLPEEFWDNRDFFFYEGMKLVIGPTQFDYANAAAYDAATVKHKGESRIGPDNSLEGYVTGQPFPIEDIDCLGDPQAGVKIMWDHNYRWTGAGGGAKFFYSYWDRGEQLPLYYEGWAKSVRLSHRPEAQYEASGGDVFRGEKRKTASGPVEPGEIVIDKSFFGTGTKPAHSADMYPHGLVPQKQDQCGMTAAASSPPSHIFSSW
jgi:hypothetical protein